VGLLVGPLGCAKPSPVAEEPDHASPRTRDYSWMSREEWWRRHRALAQIPVAEKSRAELVFLGDSIVEGWDTAAFEKSYGAYHALRFGISGDMTQHLLWRIEHGEQDGAQPRVVVLLIGTNNLGNDNQEPEGVARGVAAVVRAIVAKWPAAELLVLGLLPRDEPHSPLRQRVLATNVLLARIDDGHKVRYVDIGKSFTSREGTIPLDVMADGLHPTPRGYGIFAESLDPWVRPRLAHREGPAPSASASPSP
jgi:lysophospholipase L1-like esterase